MIQFLQPIWLWAIGAITVPLFIHLWNIRQGKTLKIGSIAFLSESTRAHARSLRLSELLLLILRCLLLILLAFLLSKPVWVSQPGDSKEKGWVLIGPEYSSEIYTHYKSSIDSLLNAGFTLHRFQPPFETTTLSDTSAPAGNLTYWKTVQELNQYVPSSLPVHVFTANSAKNFTGNRPAVSLAINWHTYTPEDSTSFIEKVFTTNNDSIRTITAHSKAGGNWFTYKNTSSGDVTSDTATLRIYLYTDQYIADANYVKAALHAIRDFTQQRILVIPVTGANPVITNADWLFWLSDKMLPGNTSAKKIFTYATGKFVKQNTSILAENFQFELYKQYSAGNNFYPVWLNGSGETVLDRNIEKNIYHFYSRFNPQWNNLTWNERFPSLIYSLLSDDTQPTVTPGNKLAINNKQVMPVTVKEDTLLPKEKLYNPTDLSRVFWIIVCLLFLAERLVTYHSKRSAA